MTAENRQQETGLDPDTLAELRAEGEGMIRRGVDRDPVVSKLHEPSEGVSKSPDSWVTKEDLKAAGKKFPTPKIKGGYKPRPIWPIWWRPFRIRGV